MTHYGQGRLEMASSWRILISQDIQERPVPISNMSVATQTVTTATTLSTELDTKSTWRQPDISYAPDREKWSTRTAQRLAEDPTLLSIPFPEGFPRKLDSPLVWEGKDWKNESQWVYNLSPAELKEIDEAVRHFHGKVFYNNVNFFCSGSC
jgi:hypothetical protein